MKLVALIAVSLIAIIPSTCGRAKPYATAPAVSTVGALQPAIPPSASLPPAKVDFATQVKPILESRCNPCHFAGGTMYERLPFDRAETVNTLGTRLFSRIKDEKEQHVIREFLSQQSKSDNNQTGLKGF